MPFNVALFYSTQAGRSAAQVDRVQQRALMKLNRRAMSEGELRRKLRAEGFEGPAVDAAMEGSEVAQWACSANRVFPAAVTEEWE